ncbi:MAG: rhodanese-like domain-containing protein [Candidatus Binatia bacterium]|nr:rhodanese-like domain-containing protein [Candidatus Binatia bacterium]
MKHAPGFLRLVEAARRQIKEVSIDEVKDMLARGEPVLLLDVREESEWQRGHLPGAKHLCKGVLERDIESLCPDVHTPIVLYCGGGYRSALAAENLQRMGYTRVASMWGGWRAWVDAGYPTEN